MQLLLRLGQGCNILHPFVFLHRQFLDPLDPVLFHIKVLQFRNIGLLPELVVGRGTFFEHRNKRFETADVGVGGCEALLALFDHQFGHFQTRLMFVQLIAQQLALHCELRWIGPWRRRHGVLTSQHGAQTRHVEPRRLQFVHQAVVVGTICRGVQFDQYLPFLDLLPVLHVDGANDAALQGLNDFGAAA